MNLMVTCLLCEPSEPSEITKADDSDSRNTNYRIYQTRQNETLKHNRIITLQHIFPTTIIRRNGYH